MDKKRLWLRFWGIFVMLFLVAAVFSTATYAWFTANRVVGTDRATARTGTDTLELQLSSAGGASFRGSSEAAIVQVNSTSQTELMPVSTADLKNFVYCPFTNGEEMADHFSPVQNEEYYYHGRLYLKAVSGGKEKTGKLALYLDESGEGAGPIVSNGEDGLLSAARLGFTFDGASPVILSLTDRNTAGETGNTVIGGVKLGRNEVIQNSGGEMKGVADPCVSLSERKITIEGTRVVLPEQPLLLMELNREYTMDVYFYLEGCDPDCTDDIWHNGVDLQLAFYGILEE